MTSSLLPGESLNPRRYLRRWSRRDVRIAANVEVLLRDGKCFTTGTAMVRNISLRGALLGKLVLRKQVFPAAWFRIRLRFLDPEYKGLGALCRAVRIGRGGEFEVAVEFEDFWADNEGK